MTVFVEVTRIEVSFSEISQDDLIKSLVAAAQLIDVGSVETDDDKKLK